METFTDYYEILQISQNAELKTIDRVYKLLATRYHPDNPETGDHEKFLLLTKAVEVLSDPAQRAAYDAHLQEHRSQPLPVFETKDFVEGIASETNRRLGILCLLYMQRKTNLDRPSLSMLDLEQIMSMPREHLEFSTWYLRDKGYARREDGGELQITASGVDHVESNLPDNRIVCQLLRLPKPLPPDQSSSSSV
jgi:curved DNA-binding protein CbpA